MYKIVVYWMPSLAILLWLAAAGIIIYFNHNAKVIGILGLILVTATSFFAALSDLKAKVFDDVSYATSVVIDQSNLPVTIVLPESPFSEKMSKLAIYAFKIDDHKQRVPVVSASQNQEELLSMHGELIQYAMLRTLWDLSQDMEGNTTVIDTNQIYSTPKVQTRLNPPSKQEFRRTDLEKILSKNRFANTQNEIFLWTERPLLLPEDTILEIGNTETSPKEYFIKLKKNHYFEIEFMIRFSSAANPPSTYVAPEGTRAQGLFYRITQKAQLFAMTAENPSRSEYEKWINTILKEMQKRFDN